MQLALKKSPASDASRWDRFVAWAIKARLASDYCHGGIVIGGDLYHAQPGTGLCLVKKGDWSPGKWDLIDIPHNHGYDARALERFQSFRGTAYDWYSLLSFVGVPARHQNRFYCFEWCWLSITEELPTGRVTPERLLAEVLRNSLFQPRAAHNLLIN